MINRISSLWLSWDIWSNHHFTSFTPCLIRLATTSSTVTRSYPLLRNWLVIWEAVRPNRCADNAKASAWLFQLYIGAEFSIVGMDTWVVGLKILATRPAERFGPEGLAAIATWLIRGSWLWILEAPKAWLEPVPGLVCCSVVVGVRTSSLC